MNKKIKILFYDIIIINFYNVLNLLISYDSNIKTLIYGLLESTFHKDTLGMGGIFMAEQNGYKMIHVQNDDKIFNTFYINYDYFETILNIV